VSLDLSWQHGEGLKPAYFSHKFVFIRKNEVGVTYLFYFISIEQCTLVPQALYRAWCLQVLRKFNKILYNAILLKSKILLQDFHWNLWWKFEGRWPGDRRRVWKWRMYGGRLGPSSIFILLRFNFFLITIYLPLFMQLVFSLYQNLDL
jgi:hypothetical protein